MSKLGSMPRATDEISAAIDEQSTARQNRRVLGGLTVAAFAMLGLGFASKPLYDTFCKVTGYGGTTRVATENTNAVYERVIRVEFDANTAKELGWDFGPEQRYMDVKVGDNALAFYHARNLTNAPTLGTSNFNVTPIKAAPYFSKLECFCFTEQALAAGETAEFPVVFFLDPLLLEDGRMDEITKVTLSYTFFPVEQGEALKVYSRPEIPEDAARARDAGDEAAIKPAASPASAL